MLMIFRQLNSFIVAGIGGNDTKSISGRNVSAKEVTMKKLFGFGEELTKQDLAVLMIYAMNRVNGSF